MGYRLVSQTGRISSVGALSVAINDLIGNVERMRIAAIGALDRALIASLVRDVAKRFGMEVVGDLSKRKGYVPRNDNGYLTEVQTKESNSSEFTFCVGPQKIKLRLEPDELGASQTVCPNCGSSTVGKKPAVAHNVVPQEVWHKIVRAALLEWLQNVESGVLVGKGVKFYSTLSGQFSGVLVDQKFGLEKDGNKKIVGLLGGLGLINSSYAAQDNSGKQCLECERKQSNATLLQRFTLISEKKLDSQIKSNAVEPAIFIGQQLTGLAERFQAADKAASVETRGGMAELLGRVTLAQIGRFLVGMEKCINDEFEKQPVSDLNKLLIDHWDEFVWTFRSVAMAKCGANYTGNLGIGGLDLK